MDFSEMWLRIGAGLTPGVKIKNWTVAKGYLGDEFAVVSVESNHLVINSPNAETILKVAKRDFEYMFLNWDEYCAGRLNRQAVVAHTRVSKYTMSVLKHIGM